MLGRALRLLRRADLDPLDVRLGHQRRDERGGALRRGFETTRPLARRGKHEPDGVGAGEHRLERRHRERLSSFADGHQHVLHAVRTVSDDPAADGVGGALEGVKGTEERAHLGGMVRAALDGQEGRADGVEVLGRLRPEVLENVSVPGVEGGQLVAEPPGHRCGRGSGGRGAGLGDAARGRAVQALPQARDGLAQGGGDLGPLARLGAGRPLEHALDAGGFRGDDGKAMERGRAPQPVSHHQERLDVAVSGQAGSALLEDGDRVPGLHEKDAQQELPVGLRLGHDVSAALLSR
jgi:hypothetical protein